MRIDELKRIVEENGYKLIDNGLVIFIYGYSHGSTDEFKTEIRISKLRNKDISIETGVYCEEEEFNVIKASVAFAETSPEDREEECAMTSLFTQKIEELGFQTRDNGENYIVANKNGNLMAIVSKKGRKQLNTDFVAWNELSDEKKDMLFDLFICFTSTPPEDMEVEE